MYDSYYEPPEPSEAEQALFDRFSDEHPEWTNQQLWDAVDKELEEREEDMYYAEQLRDFGLY